MVGRKYKKQAGSELSNTPGVTAIDLSSLEIAPNNLMFVNQYRQSSVLGPTSGDNKVNG